MIRSLWNKWKYSRQKDSIDILLMYIVSSGTAGIKLPFEDNLGNVVELPVIGYNADNVYIDIDHHLAFFPKDRMRLSDLELDKRIMAIEPALIPPKSKKLYKHLNSFKELEGQAVRLRHTITGQIHKYENFCLDCSSLMQSDSRVYHLPIMIAVGWISKVMYLEHLEVHKTVK